MSSSDGRNSFAPNFCCNIPEGLVAKGLGLLVLGFFCLKTKDYIFKTLVEQLAVVPVVIAKIKKLGLCSQLCQ